jgi:hypothetical protein
VEADRVKVSTRGTLPLRKPGRDAALLLDQTACETDGARGDHQAHGHAARREVTLVPPRPPDRRRGSARADRSGGRCAGCRGPQTASTESGTRCPPPEFNTFAAACTSPDYPRRRATEHYVNLPRDVDGLADDSCPLTDGCVVSAINKDVAVLSSPSATEQERLEALKYLGHWATSDCRSMCCSRTTGVT